MADLNKKTLIVIALNLQEGGSGFCTRVRMECSYLEKYFNIVILTDSTASIEEWMNRYEVVIYSASKINIPKARVLFNKRLMQKSLEQLLIIYPEAIIYCESLKPLIYLTNLKIGKKNRLVYDCHGAEAAEKEFKSPGIAGKISSKYMYQSEQTMLRRCDLVITVTNRQYELFGTNTPYVKFPMIPSGIFFDEANHRESIRKELCIDNSADIYAYSGGADKWQMCEETIRFYKKIEEQKQNTVLLILSNAKKIFQEFATKYKLNNYIITSVKYKDMPKYLDACDFGFCLRQDIIVNRVASPTKIYEYLARNVKPIITDCIGDFSTELKEKNLACIIRPQDAIQGELINPQLLTKSETFNGKDYVEQISRDYVERYRQALLHL